MPSGFGEVPEGWIQTYRPASTVEILHNGVPTEVELIEPLRLDPFGSGTLELYYRVLSAWHERAIADSSRPRTCEANGNGLGVGTLES